MHTHHKVAEMADGMVRPHIRHIPDASIDPPLSRIMVKIYEYHTSHYHPCYSIGILLDMHGNSLDHKIDPRRKHHNRINTEKTQLVLIP